MDRNGVSCPGCVSDGGPLCLDARYFIEVRTSRLRPSSFLGANRMARSKFLESVSIKRPLRDLSSEQFESCDCGDGGAVLTCSMAGYAFARLRFRGAKAIFSLLLTSLMMPIQAHHHSNVSDHVWFESHRHPLGNHPPLDHKCIWSFSDASIFPYPAS